MNEREKQKTRKWIEFKWKNKHCIGIFEHSLVWVGINKIEKEYGIFVPEQNEKKSKEKLGEKQGFVFIFVSCLFDNPNDIRPFKHA